jgi:DNA-binding CsgD family transcriptional regulator
MSGAAHPGEQHRLNFTINPPEPYRFGAILPFVDSICAADGIVTVEPDAVPLTSAESWVLSMAAIGLSSKQTGGGLFISEDTIKDYRSNILKKTDTTTIQQAIANCFDTGYYNVKQPLTTICTLGPRQHEVLRLSAEGKTADEIAATMEISTHTVATHYKALRSRLRVNKITSLVFTAYISEKLRPQGSTDTFEG